MRNSKQNLVWLWQNTERILILIFAATFTLNIRKVFLTPYSFLNGQFNEYLTPSFSWADLLIVGTLLIFAIKYIICQFGGCSQSEILSCHNYSIASIHSSLSNISRETSFLLIFLAWAGLSIVWSQYPIIALYRFFTLLEIGLFIVLATKLLQKDSWLDAVLLAIFLNSLFQSLVGIVQFLRNGSMGLHFLGESILGPNVNGVAKIIIDGEKHIRAYGTFPHPNILAGFLLIPLFAIIVELIFRMTRLGNVSHETLLSRFPTYLLYVILGATGLGLFLTFSRSAFLGFFTVILIYFFVIRVFYTSKRRQCHFIKIIPTFLGILILVFILKSDTSFFSSQSLGERQLYQTVSYETISNNFGKGVGLGQFVLNEYNIRPNLEGWQYQPVHNIYLLMFCELGAIGFGLIILFIIFIYKNIYWLKQDSKKLYLTNTLFYCILSAFLLISFFDHYFWDIRAGQFLFAVAFLFRKNSQN